MFFTSASTFAGVASRPVSVSAGSRGTSTQPSVAAEVALESKLAWATGFAPSETRVWLGGASWSVSLEASGPAATALTEVSPSSVSPALASVGSEAGAVYVVVSTVSVGANLLDDCFTSPSKERKVSK